MNQLEGEERKFSIDEDVREGEKLADAFVRNYCNDHQRLRWLRGAFIDEDDKMETIIRWLNLADHRLSSQLDEVIKEIEGGLEPYRFSDRKRNDVIHWFRVKEIIQLLKEKKHENN